MCGSDMPVTKETTSLFPLFLPLQHCETKDHFRAVKPAVHPRKRDCHRDSFSMRRHTPGVCSNARVTKGANETSHPRRPPPAALTICIASSIHFSVSSAVTEPTQPPGAGVAAAFASMPRPGRGARRQGLGPRRSAGNGTRRRRATVSREVERRRTRERILDGPGCPGPVSGDRGAAAATESAAAQL